MKKDYRNYYLASDSTRIYLYSLLIPYLAFFVLMAVYLLIASSINMKPEEFTNTLPVIMINAVFMQLCFVVISLLFVYKRRINIVKATKFDVKPNAWMLAIAICMGFAFLWFTTPAMDLFERGLTALGCEIKGDLGFELNSAGIIIFAIFALGILPAFAEEFIFRGVILQGLRRYGNWFAIIISALLFMLIHGNIQQTIYQFAFGVLAGYLVIKTGSIWISIIFHAINNTFVIAFSSIQTCMGIESVATKIDALYIIKVVEYLILLAIVIYVGIKLLNVVKNKNKQNNNASVVQATEKALENDRKMPHIQDKTTNSQSSGKSTPKSTDNNLTNEATNDNGDESKIEEEFAKIKFKQGFVGFMRDGAIKKEGLTGFFIALTITVLTTISMFFGS